VLNHFGFDVEEFGPNTFQVRAMPTLFTGSDPAAALRALVEDFEEDEAPLQDEVEARLAARVCKRMAVKGGSGIDDRGTTRPAHRSRSLRLAADVSAWETDNDPFIGGHARTSIWEARCTLIQT
jgi:DNA mismatch repair ATPase MutL